MRYEGNYTTDYKTLFSDDIYKQYIDTPIELVVDENKKAAIKLYEKAILSEWTGGIVAAKAKEPEINEEIPADYELITDFNYIIKRGDRYRNRLNKQFYDFEHNSQWNNSTLSDLNDYDPWYKEILSKIDKTLPPQIVNKNMEVNARIPNGFTLVNDENYIIKAGDMFRYLSWTKNEPYYRVSAYHDVYNQTIKQSNKYNADTTIVATKEPVKPRFHTDKPFPYGY